MRCTAFPSFRGRPSAIFRYRSIMLPKETRCCPEEGNGAHISSPTGNLQEEVPICSSHHDRKVMDEKAVDQVPSRKLEWWSVAFVQVAEVAGVAVLTIPNAFAQLGWIPSVILIVLNAFGSVLVGFALSQAKAMYPAGSSYTLMAKQSHGNPLFVNCVRLSTLVLLFIANASYFMSISQELSMIFKYTAFCDSVWGIFAFLVLFSCAPVRSLSQLSPVMTFNLVTITFVVLITLAYLTVKIVEGNPSTRPSTEWVASSLSLESFFSGAGMITSSFLGQFVYLEVMDEMRKPEDFMKSFSISIPFQLVCYFACGGIGYIYRGKYAEDSLLKLIDPQTDTYLLPIVSALLILHMISAWLVNGLVLCRKLHNTISPSTLSERTLKAWKIWIFSCVCILSLCYLIINIIPGFGVLTGLAGNLVCPSLMYAFPFSFWIFGGRKYVSSKTISEIGAENINGQGSALSRVRLFTASHPLIVFAVLVLIAWSLVLTSFGTVFMLFVVDETYKAGSIYPFYCSPSSYVDQYVGA